MPLLIIVKDILLKIEDLHATVDGKEILKGVNLEIPKGETHVLLGPNGAGKSTLIAAVLGDPTVKITKGRIFLNGEDISKKKMNERVKKGIGIVFQSPPKVAGVKLEEMACICRNGSLECTLDKESRELAKKLDLERFLHRDVNAGFSGGERKRSEVFQLMLQKPALALIDEPDSGVDVENLRLIGELLGKFLKGRGALVVTHMGAIFDYLEANWGHVMLDGRIACSEKPTLVMKHIVEKGFEECAECLRK